jgi:hypothetical protein
MKRILAFYASRMKRKRPKLHSGPAVSVETQVARFNAIAKSRLDAAGSESGLPEINAWRGVFSRRGVGSRLGAGPMNKGRQAE